MAVRYGYSLNAWNTLANSVRKETNERTFKVLSAGGYEGVELQIKTGRFCPFGRPAMMKAVYGGIAEFDAYLKNLGIRQVVAWDYNAGAACGEEDTPGRNPSDPAQHEDIVNALVPFAEALNTLGAKLLCVRAMNSYWTMAPVTDEKILAAAECWNKVGAMTAKYGVKVLVDIDWFCAANSRHAIDLLMQNTDPELVGLCLDAAELAMVELDPVEIYEAYADRVGLVRLEQIFVADSLKEYTQPFAEDILNNGGVRCLDRWFWEVGSPEHPGLVDLPKLMKSVKDHDYDGWVIIESKQSPDPAESALFSGWYVNNVLKKI